MLNPINVENFQLTIEQSFRLQTYKNEVTGISRESLEEMFVEICRQMMVKENIIRSMAKDLLGCN